MTQANTANTREERIQHTLVLPPLETNLVQQRLELLKYLEHVQEEAKELEPLTGRVPAGSASDLPPLTSNRQPPGELTAAIAELRRHLHTVEQMNQQIDAAHNEIQQIKDSVRNTIMVLVFITLLTIGGIVFFVVMPALR